MRGATSPSTLTPSFAMITPRQEPEPTRWPPSLSAIGFCIVAAGLLTLSACSTRQDPHYNVYDQGVARDRTLLENAEDLHALAEQALDNLDRRVENIVY